ncbi:MAG: carboxypeptidase-like regulatory domain-containing protein, partial [Alistipes sp.]
MKNNFNAVFFPRKNPWSLLLIFAACLFLTLPVAGQTPPRTKIASGVVVDEKGTPIIGSNIIVKGTTSGTTSDSNGHFSLNVPASGKTIVASFIGMTSAEIPVGENLRVILQNSASELDEVVVVGYGVQKKATLSGAIANITNKDILTTKGSSLAVALAGKVPGLRIRQTDGMPGSFATGIDIRGMGTPMIVIDGVLRSETTEFQKLNPEDIESITVLKDASAAIFGMNSA